MSVWLVGPATDIAGNRFYINRNLVSVGLVSRSNRQTSTGVDKVGW